MEIATPQPPAPDESDCSQTVDSELSVESFEALDLDAVLALQDHELDDFADGDAVGEMSLTSFLAPGGEWRGSEAGAQRAERVGLANGLRVTSRKRSTGSTGSDHHVSQLAACAVDLSNGTRPTAAMLRTARQIAAALGYAWPSNGYLQTATSARGYRAQLIYNSSVVPDHHNHVHFGVRKVR